jgi:NAD(P)H:quinone oxidoreductase type IV
MPLSAHSSHSFTSRGLVRFAVREAFLSFCKWRRSTKLKAQALASADVTVNYQVTVHSRCYETEALTTLQNANGAENMTTKVKVIFYSMYGHIYRMAEAVAAGAREIPGVEVSLHQVPEVISDEILEKIGAKAARAQFAHVPVAKIEELLEADALIFGTPTRFGNMCGQMRNYLDQAGGLWAQNKLVDKVGSVFCSTGTQHGGQETTITSFHCTLMHLGMIIVGTPYSEPRLTNMNEITGGTPYGASTLAGADGRSRPVSDNELAIARFQGRHVASIAKRLKESS